MLTGTILQLLCLPAVLVHLLGRPTGGEPVNLVLPKSKRTEGRITLEYTRSNETLKHELAFSEVIDSDTKRSKVSIGYISYEPTVYYSRAGSILVVDTEGKCACLKQLGWKFVPELDWFLELTYTKEELDKALPAGKDHYIGPTGLALMMAKYTKYDHVETHRNVQCLVSAARYDREKAKDILYEVFIPNIKMFDNPLTMNFFSLRETVKNGINAQGEKFTATMTLDYFYTEEIDKTSVHHLDKLEEDLNLPFGRGCSEFVRPSSPSTSLESFIMGYRHESAQSSVVLAYDRKANYLRKELVGKSVMVWDLGEHLLYHVDQRVGDGKLTNEVDVQVPFDGCSVLRVEQRSTGKIRVPYGKTSDMIDVLEFLGAKRIAYMGQTTVRDLPSQVFETIVETPPAIFNMDSRTGESDTPDAFDYIVQFHIFRINEGTANKYLDQIVLVGDQFWPARITLTRRHKPTGRMMLLDRLEVSDFHWGLYGWTKKPSELFMLPECFNNEDEQLRINLALSATNNYSQSDTLKALRHNKYKLEEALLENLFKDLSMSRMHLTEFQMELRPNDVLANVVISDRDDDRRLTYFGPGELPSPNSYLNNRIALRYSADDDESTCVFLASHVSEISMVIYCPRRAGVQEPTCTAIFGEAQPVMKQPTEAKTSSSTSSDPFAESEACQVYRYEPGKPPNAATRDVAKVKESIKQLKFQFNADSKSKMVLQCKVEDFDVSHEVQLIAINNYQYALSSSGSSHVSNTSTVRAYETVAYETLGDCTKMCNLDVSCKSYSFCHVDSAKAECVLSSLDLRQNEVEDQLVHAPLSTDNRSSVIVYDKQGIPGTETPYTLDLKRGCNIYEKNFLSAFAQTDEILRLEPEMAKSFITMPSLTECARWIEWLETQRTEFKSAMFAYCAGSNTCLFDEALFVSMNGTQSVNPASEDETGAESGAHELSCQIYRRRYQAYFHVSTMVLRPKLSETAEEHWLKQTQLSFNTVEECARACWDSFGHNCLSFDFCTPRVCTLNLLDRTKPLPTGDPLSQVEHESRAGCLHYERDLKWDQLRRDHLIGHHNPFSLGPGAEEATSANQGGLLGTIFLTFVTGVLFIVGLALGRILNDRLENMTMSRRNVLVEPYAASPGGARGGYSSGSSVIRNMQRISSDSNISIENEIYEDPDAIRMEEFGQKQDAGSDELDKSSEDGSNPGSSNQGSSSSKKPGYIDVPNLMQV